MYKYIFLFCFSLIFACSDSEPKESNDPSNLLLDINISNDGSGIVKLTATANNTNEYQFDMDDNSALINNTSGYLEHTYEISGSYLIEVRAIGEEGRYIKTEERINVLAGDPIDIGEGYSTPINYQGMNLVWNDEFNGGALNTQDWSFDLGNGCPDLCGWGNNELEYYRKENCWVGNGVLTIEARKEDYQGFNYTSSKILTRGSQNFQFGRIDIRALLPQGQGIWPALWMLGSNISSVGWPKCGEIDIMEMAGGGGRENKVTANVFWDDNGKRDDVKSYTLPSGTFADEYHVFSLIWDQNEINWLVNDIKYHTVDITPETKNELRNPFFIILNVAVGGNYPGNPDATSIYPTQMKVDYVRVFQNF